MTRNPHSDMLERCARAIADARCEGREGPYGGYDYGHQHEDDLPEGGRYVIRDFRDPGSDDWGKWVHQTADRGEHERMYRLMTDVHQARACLTELLTPDEAMIEAGQGATEIVTCDGGLPDSELARVFTAMIRTAMGESE